MKNKGQELYVLASASMYKYINRAIEIQQDLNAGFRTPEDVEGLMLLEVARNSLSLGKKSQRNGRQQ